MDISFFFLLPDFSISFFTNPIFHSSHFHFPFPRSNQGRWNNNSDCLCSTFVNSINKCFDLLTKSEFAGDPSNIGYVASLIFTWSFDLSIRSICSDRTMLLWRFSSMNTFRIQLFKKFIRIALIKTSRMFRWTSMSLKSAAVLFGLTLIAFANEFL